MPGTCKCLGADEPVTITNGASLRAVVFDLDGTILDTGPAIIEAWRRLYAKSNLPFPEQEFIAMTGTWSPHWDPYAPLDIGLDMAARRQLRQEHERIETALMQTVGPRPGISEWLSWCHRMQVPVACASAAPLAGVQRHLARLRLRGYFQIITAREHVAQVKPAPDLFIRAVSELDVPAQDTLAVEDSLPGVRAAKAASLLCAVYPNAYTPPLALDEADLVLNPAEASPASAFAAALAGRANCR